MRRISAFLSLFTSVSTLICCALPALFVVLGFGAAFAGLVSSFPGLIWISENKIWFFGFGGIMLLIGGYFQYKNLNIECPPEDEAGAACKTTRDWSVWIYGISVALYLIGAFFAFLAQRL